MNMSPFKKNEQTTSPATDTTSLDSIAARVSRVNTLLGGDRLDSGRFLIWSAVFALVAFFLWAAWAEIDQITRAQGTVIASSRNQLVQTQDGGVLQTLYVKEGDRVHKGQLLASFDKTKAEASYLESRAKAASLKAAALRLRAEVLGGPLNFPPDLADYPQLRDTQKVLFEKRRTMLNQELGALEQSLALVKAELEMNLPLLKTGDVSKAEVLKLQRQAAEVQALITNKRNKYFQDAQAELAKAEEDLAGIEQILAQRQDLLLHTEITSPMDGIIRNIRITTLGGVARPGEEIMQIVPLDDDLLIEAKVKPSDIAFVKPGLPATIKLAAYDYTIYGSFHGTVSYISADTMSEEARPGANEQPYYRVQIKAVGRNFRGGKAENIEIQPGMTATVEIKTGSNTILRFLTKPVTKTITESMGER